MNKVILMGRLTKDPEIRYSSGDNTPALARYTLAVDRKFANKKEENGQNTDFIYCIAFGKGAEFAEKYLHQGSKIVIAGRIQTGSYINRDGKKVYTTDVVVEEQEFAESKSSDTSGSACAGTQNGSAGYIQGGGDDSGFMNIPEGLDEELPFN